MVSNIAQTMKHHPRPYCSSDPANADRTSDGFRFVPDSVEKDPRRLKADEPPLQANSVVSPSELGCECEFSP